MAPFAKALYLLLALAGLPQDPVDLPQDSVGFPLDVVGPPQDIAADISQEALSRHNSFRALHGASALTWNNNLAAAANKWASRCVFEHSGGQVGKFGGMTSKGDILSYTRCSRSIYPTENLAAGTGNGYTVTSGVKAWTDEAKDYNPRNPKPSHFTQVVWKGSKELGCAFVDCPAGSIFPAKFGVRSRFTFPPAVVLLS